LETTVLLFVLLLLSLVGFLMGRNRSLAMAGGSIRKLHSLPNSYGWYLALWCGLPALFVLAVWLAFEPRVVEGLVVSSLPQDSRDLPQAQLALLLNDIRNLATGNIVSQTVDPALRDAADQYGNLKTISFAALSLVTLVLAIVCIAIGRRFVSPTLRAREHVERALMLVLIVSSTIAIFTTIGIVFSLLFEAIRFFRLVPPSEFLFGLEWSPQTAIREEQVGQSGSFGAVPIFAGTLLITFIAMCVSVPIGLMSAIYLADYADRRVRAVVKPILEILAGIPTVVYGFFAALTVAPAVRGLGESVGLGVASESALAAGLVMGIMIIPFVSSLSDDVMSAVPQSLREGSYGLGATKSETIRRVVFPAALPGIVGAVLLAVSRAIGETMIVVMAAGLAANLTANPLEAVTTVTVQIVTLLVGDQEFDSAKTLAAFALGLVLFFVTLSLNVVALRVVQKYREKYD
jgi:phosphate transport system permease protein